MCKFYFFIYIWNIQYKEPEYTKVFDKKYDAKVKEGDPKIFSAIGRINLHLTKIANHYFHFMDDWMSMNYQKWIDRTNDVSKHTSYRHLNTITDIIVLY